MFKKLKKFIEDFKEFRRLRKKYPLQTFQKAEDLLKEIEKQPTSTDSNIKISRVKDALNKGGHQRAGDFCNTCHKHISRCPVHKDSIN